MPAVTPAIRKWLAHLARGDEIYANVDGPILRWMTLSTDDGRGHITNAMVENLTRLGFVASKLGSKLVHLTITERGYLALKASEVDGTMLQHLKAATFGIEVPYRAQSTRGKLYRLGLINDRGTATLLGARVVDLIQEG